jgi:peroxiredoxin/uncharacterized protein YxeA
VFANLYNSEGILFFTGIFLYVCGTKNLKVKRMKKVLYLIAAAVLAVSCTTTPSYRIHGSVTGVDSGLVKLQKRVSGQFQTMDSVQLVNGVFEFDGQVSSPEYVYLSVSGKRGFVPFFLENSMIEIKFHTDSMMNAKITGSATQDEYLAYQDGMKAFNSRGEELSTQYQAADSLKDETMMAEVEKKFDELWNDEIKYTKDWVTSHPASVVSPYLIRTQLIYDMEWDELEKVTNALDSTLADNEYVKFFRDRIEVLKKVAVGQPALDFTQNDTTGNPVTLSSLISKSGLLLVDFWASWCGPCRGENPNVVAIYKDYHKKGFEILGVSLDNDRAGWVKAIRDDKLSWYHVSDIKGWQNAAAQLYGVQAIPHSVLIDKNGVIIAKNLRGDELRKKVAEILDKK